MVLLKSCVCVCVSVSVCVCVCVKFTFNFSLFTRWFSALWQGCNLFTFPPFPTHFPERSL